MGEIADDMTDGTICCLCNAVFKHPSEEKTSYTHGYPVVCRTCFKQLNKDDRKIYQIAQVDTFN